jgi:hypothetical protein
MRAMSLMKAIMRTTWWGQGCGMAEPKHCSLVHALIRH